MAISSHLIQDFAASKYPELVRWSESLAEICQQKTTGSEHAQLWNKWMTWLEDFPDPKDCALDASGDTIVIANKNGPLAADDAAKIRERVLELCPWRIGPWDLFGVDLQTEWDSSKKWNRFSESVYFDDARVLDVGCNNGYFGWKAIDAGARSVVGCDPFLLYNVQHEIFRRYSADKHRHHILPIAECEVFGSCQLLGWLNDGLIVLGLLMSKWSMCRSPIRLSNAGPSSCLSNRCLILLTPISRKKRWKVVRHQHVSRLWQSKVGEELPIEPLPFKGLNGKITD